MPPPGIHTSGGGGTVHIGNSHAAYYTGNGSVDLVVWKGFRNIDVWEYTSGPAGEWMKLKDDRVCEWKRSKDANAVIINGKEYSLENGRMLMLSVQGEEVRVQQLDYDLSSLGSSNEEIEQALTTLAETNDAIREFVDAAQPIDP